MSIVAGSVRHEIKAKICEAEAYCSHDLYKEAITVFESIIDNYPEIDADFKISLKNKIGQLQNKRQDQVSSGHPALTTDELTVIKGTWDSQSESVAEIIDSASAFNELGMFKESVSEYVKLLRLNYKISEVSPLLIESLFKSYESFRVPAKVEKIIRKNNFKNSVTNEIKYFLGLELDKNSIQKPELSVYGSKIKETHRLSFPSEIDISQSSNVNYDSKYDYLIREKIVSKSQIQNALTLSKKSGKSIEYVLIENLRVKKEYIGQSLSLFYKIPFKTFSEGMDIPYELLGNLKKTYLLKHRWVPLSWDMSEGSVEVLIDNPDDLEKTDSILSLVKATRIDMAVGIKEDIQKVIRYFFDRNNFEFSTDTENSSADGLNMISDIVFEEDEEEEEIVDEFSETSSQIVKMVDQIFISAYRKGVSDIHIEPSVMSKKTMIRFRIDGVCHEVLRIPITNARALMSRIKIMAGLDIAERRLPQDGKIKFKRKGVKPFELRLATIPTTGGFEDGVLRILGDSGAMKIENLNLSDRSLLNIKNIITQPYGLFLVVGPTGSGKTTTLHSTLGYINNPEIKIWTAEDPVEITQPGLRQVECNPKIGLDFARVMRSFLRADPDVIMIGEMRDFETASIGIEASLTGHLVFSTLHTNSAPETITRLLDMGLNALNFSDAFLGVLAQRLVRRLCNKCKQPYKPSSDEFKEIKTIYGEKYFSKSGLEHYENLELFKAEGCPDCSSSGYRGRIAIHELMCGTEKIKKMIKAEKNTEELFKQSIKEGMRTLAQDGIEKVFMGITDINEIKRVCIS